MQRLRSLARRVIARSGSGPATSPGLGELQARHGNPPAPGRLADLAECDRVLAPLHGRALHVIVLGGRAEASVWADYLGRSMITVVGSTADDAGSTPSVANPRVEVIAGDVGSRRLWARLARGRRPGLVVLGQQSPERAVGHAFEALFPVLVAGGVFLTERVVRAGSGLGSGAVHELALGLTGPRRPSPDLIEYARRSVRSVTVLSGAALIIKTSDGRRRYRLAGVGRLSEHPVLTDLGASYDRVPAEIVEASPHVKQQWTTLMATPQVTLPAAASGELGDITVLRSGIVLTSTGRIVDETLGNGARILRRTSGLYRPVDDSVWVAETELPEPEPLPAGSGSRDVLLKQFNDTNYGHWLIDTLPRVALLADLPDDRRPRYLISAQSEPAMHRVVTDSLRLAGINRDQTLELDRPAYALDRLTVLGEVTRHPVAKSRFAVEFLERLAAPVAAAGAERVFVSRNRFSRRRLLNEDELVPALRARGYMVVHCEELTLAEQIALFKGARYVVGAMGAALSNLVFSPPGVSVLSLATETMAHNYFYDLVCHKAGRYRGLQGRAEGTTKNLASDFVIDPALFEAGLRWLHD